MTRQRKTHLVFLALVPAVVFGTLRCADSPSEPRARTVEAVALEPSVAARLAKLHEQYDWIGEYHNDALKYVLASLQRLPAKNLNRRAICETALAAYRDFHRSRRHVDEPAEIAAAAAKECASSGPRASVAAFSMAVPALPRTDLSSDAQNYLNQILSAVDATNSTADLNTAVAGIETNAAASLSDAEAGAVMIVGSVTESSAAYWDVNLSAWLPYTSTMADYSRVSSSRLSPGESDQIGPSIGPRLDFWSDFKAAGKRALRGDVGGALRAVLGAGIAGLPVEYEVVLAGAASGSVMAVLFQ